MPVVGVLLLLGIPAFAGDFSAHRQRRVRARRLLADVGARASPSPPPGRCPTRPASATTRAGSRAATATSPCCSRPRSASSAACFLTTLFGAFTALCLTNLGDSYVADLVAAAPLWYVLPLLVIGLAGGVGQGVLNLYASGLDLAAIVPRVRRVHTTLITSVAAIALVFAGTFAFSAVDSITAMTLVLNGVAVPWVIVNVLGFLVARRRDVRPARRPGLGRPQRPLLVHRRLQPARLAAWAAGSAFGLLAVTTELYTGPLANLAGGVDISLAGSALVAAAVYLDGARRLPRRREPEVIDPLTRWAAYGEKPDYAGLMTYAGLPYTEDPARAARRRRRDRRRADGRADLGLARHALRPARDPRRLLRARPAPRGGRRRAARRACA